MAFLHTSGSISFAQLQSHFGGSNPIGINEYYRNGSYVPSIYTVTTTTTTTTRQPSSGTTYVAGSTYWLTTSGIYLMWNGTNVVNGGSYTLTSTTAGGWTYYRGALVSSNYGISQYRIHRQQSTTSTSTTTTNINTGIPSSGTISMNQFYGGQN